MNRPYKAPGDQMAERRNRRSAECGASGLGRSGSVVMGEERSELWIIFAFEIGSCILLTGKCRQITWCNGRLMLHRRVP